MASDEVVEARIDASIEKRAAASAEHNQWFRSKVQQALEDPRPTLPSEEVEHRMAQRKAALSGRIQK